MKKHNAITRELLPYAVIISDFAGKVYSALKRFARIKADFYAGMGRGQKRWFVFCNCFLSAYIAFVIYTSQHYIVTGEIRYGLLVLVIKTILICMIAYNVIIFFCFKCKPQSIGVSGRKEAIKKETLIVFSALCFAILLLALAASFPGGESPDTEGQWAQVHSFSFNDWHPVIHTLLIWLVTRVIDHYAFVIFVQIAVFSIGVGYLIATLESWGFSRKILLVTGLIIILNPYTMNIMMYPWKDLALTVFLTYTTILMVNIYFSKGAWFSNGINIILFALTTGLASMVRHNGFFFTAPLYVFVVLLYSRKNMRALLAVALSVLVIYLVKVPLYNALKITKPNNTYSESIGIPMTILGDVMVKNPGRLPQEAKELLNKIASDEEWREKYVPGDYNSIKFNYDVSPIIETVPPKTLLKWVLQTCINARYDAFRAFCDVTDIVWRIGSTQIFRPASSGKNIISNILHICFDSYSGLFFSLPLVSLIFTNLGLLMLLLFVVGIFSLSKNGIKALLLVVPSAAYNLGTMLLLCGPDTRFFHFNFVITLPLLFVLLSKPCVQEESPV